MDCLKIEESNIDSDEISRLYNYAYDLFDSITIAIEEIS